LTESNVKTMDDDNYDTHYVLLCTINHMSFYFIKNHWLYINICYAVVISILENTDIYNIDVDTNHGVDISTLVS